MLAMLGLIVLIYLAAGLQSLVRPQGAGGAPTAFGSATAGGVVALDTPSAEPATATAEPPSPTTATSEPPTATAEPPTPTTLPTSTPEQPTATQAQPTLIIMPTAEAPTEAPTSAATSTLEPTAAATRAPARSTSTPAVAPTPPSVSSEVLWLYFADRTGALYVPVQRRVQVADKKVAEAAVRELIRGPQGGLERLVLPDVALLDLTIRDGTAFVNFDRPPNGDGDERGLFSIVLSLTHFPTVEQVQILVDGRPYGINGGAPVRRPVVNPLNPDRLPFDYRTTEFLPTYYPTADGDHDVRIIRLVPKTRETAASTMLALLEGPGEYAFAVQEVIPDGTALLDIGIDNGVVTVNLSSTFADAGDREAVVRTIVESLTTLPGIGGVRFEVEGQSLGALWGERYGRVFPPLLVNPE
jgi:spore germination protein GerM